MRTIKGNKFHTVTEASEILQISKHTVRAWLKRGKIKGIKGTQGEMMLISEKSINELLTEAGIDVPEEKNKKR